MNKVELTQACLEKLGEAIKAVALPDFWPALHGLITEIAPDVMCSVFAYVGDNDPTRVYDSVGTKQRDGLHRTLETVGYLISPYYNDLIKPRAASSFYHIDDVAPDDFRRSEYFRTYYSQKRVSDEGMFLIRFEGNAVFVVMVERKIKDAGFSAIELDALKAASTVIEALVCRNIQLAGLMGLVDSSKQGAVSQFRSIESAFGSEMLTNRERDVAMLILRGHSSKSAARKLSISPETERVHRRRLYARLNITSHSELFRLFFEAANFYDPILKNDPLVRYMREGPKNGQNPN